MTYQEILNDFQSGNLTVQTLFDKRKKLMMEIEKITCRPFVVYAAKIDAQFSGVPNQIVLDDVIGFSDLISDINGPNLDILVESPGGVVDAADRIVHLLRQKFSNIRFIIPGSAYSAATMIALSGNEILMDESASLGPIDPQINGIPARSILNGFETVRKKLEEEGAKSLPAYMPLLQKYDLHIFEICKDAEERGKELVENWLKSYMFHGEPDVESKIKSIVNFFADYNTHKSHARPIFLADAEKIGVKVKSLSKSLPKETESKVLREAIWNLYLYIKALFDVTPNVKVFENTKDVHWGKHFVPTGAATIMRIPNSK